MFSPDCRPCPPGLCIFLTVWSLAPGTEISVSSDAIWCRRKVMVGKEGTQVPFPTWPPLALVTDKALPHQASLSCRDSSPPTHFCASSSELTLLRADSSQNIPYSSTSLCLCPHLRAGDPHSAFVQNRKRYLFLPAECRLDFMPHSSLGPVPYWIDQPG